jgi:hypothetical protein
MRAIAREEGRTVAEVRRLLLRLGLVCFDAHGFAAGGYRERVGRPSNVRPLGA